MTTHTRTPAEVANHHVTLDIEGGWLGPVAFTCHAPATSLCHARWECECEAWARQGVNSDGLPFHDTGEDLGPLHVGRWEPDYCSLAEWADNSDEWLNGKVTAPVMPEFQGDYYTFEIVQPLAALAESPDARERVADVLEALDGTDYADVATAVLAALGGEGR